MRVTDITGQLRLLDPAALAAAGLDAGFDVLSVADQTRPRVTRISVAPSTVDVRTPHRRVTITVRASDDLAGVAFVVASFVPGLPRLNPFLATWVAGNARDGTWRAVVVLPKDTPTGSYRVSVDVRDAARNGRTVDRPARLRALGARPVRVVGYRDTGHPTISAVMVHPTALDVRTQNQTLVVGARVRDVGSGVAMVRATGFFPVRSGYLRLTSGSRTDGVWSARLLLRRCRTSAGPLRFAVHARDRAGNETLRSAPRVAIVAGDVRRPSASIAAGLVPVAGPVLVSFDEDVVGLDHSSAPVQRLVSGQPAVGETALEGTWACTDVTLAPVDCVTGPVRAARFTPGEPLRASSTYRLQLNPEHLLSITDLAGNPFDRDVLMFGTVYP
jgi:hypothetical protein